MKFYPYKKGGGAEKVLAILTFWGSFNMGALSFSHSEGGRKKFPLFKRGGGQKKLYPVLRGGGGGAKNC